MCLLGDRGASPCTGNRTFCAGDAPRAKPGEAFCCFVVVVVVVVVVVLSGVWFARSSQAFGHAGPSPAALLLLAATAACVVVVVVVVVVVAVVVLVLCPCSCQALVIVGKYDIKSFFEAGTWKGNESRATGFWCSNFVLFALVLCHILFQ